MPSSPSTHKDRPLISPVTGPHRRRTWWFGVAGLAAVAVLAGATLWATSDGDRAPVPSTHTVVYEVTGPGGRSPEIRFTTDGVNKTEKTEAVGLPWRRELTIPAAPGLTVAQVMAANGQGDSISCTITVDGHVVSSNTAKGEYSTVSCSNMIAQPA